MVMIIAEHPPQPKISVEEFDEILNNEIDLNLYSLNNGDTIRVRQIINPSGVGMCYDVFNVLDSSFCEALVNVIHKYVSWYPAMQARQKMYFSIFMQYGILDHRIKTVSSFDYYNNDSNRIRRRRSR